MRLNIFRKVGYLQMSNKPNKKEKPEYLGDMKVSIICLAMCGLVIGCRIVPSIVNAISSLKSSNTKVVLDISSSNSNNVSETVAVTTVPETTTTTEGTTTTEVTSTTTVTTSYKVHILVTGKSDKEYTIYDVVSLQTFEDDNIEIIGYNEYRKIGKTKYYRFKTSTGDVITATQDSCYLVVEE